MPLERFIGIQELHKILYEVGTELSYLIATIKKILVPALSLHEYLIKSMYSELKLEIQPNSGDINR